jgi:ATP-dependent RNA helicase HrpB
MAFVALPIDEHVPRIAGLVAAHGALVLVAPPGAGKTTRVPPALLGRGPAILLQPRRVAARSLARRIADEQGFRLGEEVGWQVRFERHFSERTRLLVVTEGILTARLCGDPLLSGFATAILDEFHERSLQGDLALALLKQARKAREDLAVVVMSATLEAGPVAEFLGGCPVVEVPGRPYPVDIRYKPGDSPAAAVREALARGGGHVLCFLPGAGEIGRVADELQGAGLQGARVLPLHGALDARAQDAALAPSAERKVLLATNIAETSLTVEGVTDVVDSGWHKVMRYDAEKAIDRLDLERIPLDAAEQRAGRAGRTGPGRVVRLWDPRERLRPRREPEIRRVDLAAPLLEVVAWGGDPLSFEWFEAPPGERVAAGLELLRRLGAVEGRRLTPLGGAIRRLPLHPRLARVLVEAGGSPRAAAVCAVLSERRPTPRDAEGTTDSDVLTLVDRIGHAPFPLRQAARELEASARRFLEGGPPATEPSRVREPPDEDGKLRKALLAGFPDRVARRREPGSPRLLLASGHGAFLSRESGVRTAEFLVALDVAAAPPGPTGSSEAIVRLASAVDREWLTPTRREVVHVLDETAGRVRALERDWYDELLLAERPVAPDPLAAEEIVFAALAARGFGEAGEALLRRVRFAGLELDRDALLRTASAGATRVPSPEWHSFLPRDVGRQLERLAPEHLAVPSGRRVPLEYREDGSVVASVKLQELFGLGESPRLGPRQEPVTFSLLAPNGRPVQTTRDLGSFWERTYPEVRKELRGRYPKHPWPEDPWTAVATARAKPGRR